MSTTDISEPDPPVHINHQEKGNEADFVFVAGVNAIARQESTRHNPLFTATARMKAFRFLSGTGSNLFYAEIMSVLLSICENSHMFSFTGKGAPKIAINAE